MNPSADPRVPALELATLLEWALTLSAKPGRSLQRTHPAFCVVAQEAITRAYATVRGPWTDLPSYRVASAQNLRPRRTVQAKRRPLSPQLPPQLFPPRHGLNA